MTEKTTTQQAIHIHIPSILYTLSPTRFPHKRQIHFSQLKPEAMLNGKSISVFDDATADLLSRFERLGPSKTQVFRHASNSPSLNFEQKRTSTIVTLDVALGNDKLRELFRTFLASAYADENLGFWEQVEKFAMIPAGDEKGMRACAGRIVDGYVRSSAVNQVNLDGPTANALVEAVDGNLPLERVSEALVKASKQIYALMSDNFFLKFLSVVDMELLPARVGGEEVKVSLPARMTLLKVGAVVPPPYY